MLVWLLRELRCLFTISKTFVWRCSCPPITALVVRKSDGLPSTGFKSGKSRLTRQEHTAILQQVFAFEWSSIYIDHEEDLTWKQQREIFNLNR